MQKVWYQDRGFTLPEVTIVIVLMSIVFAIATSTWNGVVEGREVDSATNQVVADLRLAHTSATNQLAKHEVDLATNGRGYTVEPLTAGATPAETCPGASLPTRCLPEGTRFTPSAEPLEFWPDGTLRNGAGNIISGSITVTSDDGNPSHVITFNGATSRVKID